MNYECGSARARAGGERHARERRVEGANVIKTRVYVALKAKLYEILSRGAQQLAFALSRIHSPRRFALVAFSPAKLLLADIIDSSCCQCGVVQEGERGKYIILGAAKRG